MRDYFENFPIVLKQDVHWGDMDAFGHVNNTVYLRYFEDVRIAYFEEIGIFKIMSKENHGPIMAHASTDFRLPLKHPDTIHIGGRCEIIGPKKIRMYYKVYSEQFKAVAAEGDSLIIYYDYNNNRSCAIPNLIRDALQTLERPD